MKSLLICYKCKKPVNGRTYLVWNEELKHKVRICSTCKMMEKLKEAKNVV